MKEAYPEYAKRDDVELGNAYLNKYGGAITAVKSGKIKITDLPEKQRAGVGVGLAALDPEAGNQVDPMQAISIAMRQGGSEFINKGKTKDERAAIAQEIANMGGVSGYRQALPLKDLATEEESKGLTASTDLKSKIDRSLPGFEKENPFGGTGPIAGRLYDIPVIGGVLQNMASKETRENRANAGQIMALYQQMISGKVVSDAEVQRLQSFLPSGNKSETQNREDLNRLKNDIQSNMDLFEIAKREGLTANEAYDKYAKIENGKLVINKPKKSAPEILQKSGVLPSKQPKSRFTIEAVE